MVLDLNIECHMVPKIVIICALEEEFQSDKHIVIYSGVGKLNAAIATMQAIQDFEPDIILNVGTCGSRTHVKLVECGRFWDRNLEGDFKDKTIVTNRKLVSCATGDTFVRNWVGFGDEIPDVVDMEAYAIAKICLLKGVDFRCFKYVSDDGSEVDWREKIGDGQEYFEGVINELF